MDDAPTQIYRQGEVARLAVLRARCAAERPDRRSALLEQIDRIELAARNRWDRHMRRLMVEAREMSDDRFFVGRFVRTGQVTYNRRRGDDLTVAGTLYGGGLWCSPAGREIRRDMLEIYESENVDFSSNRG